jgi:hypothetical protein
MRGGFLLRADRIVQQPQRSLWPAGAQRHAGETGNPGCRRWARAKRGPNDLSGLRLRILGELRIGRSLHGICCDDGMPHRETVTKWIRQDRAGFAARYRQAREIAQNSPGYPGYTAETAERLLGELMNGRGLISQYAAIPACLTIPRSIAGSRMTANMGLVSLTSAEV